MSGFRVVDEMLCIDIPGVIDLQIPIKAFLDPEGEDIKQVSSMITSALGSNIEIFEKEPELDNLGNFALLRRERRRRIGRFFSHSRIRWQGVNSRIVRYYKYVELRAPMTMSTTSWEKLIQFLLCVAGILGILEVVSKP